MADFVIRKVWKGGNNQQLVSLPKELKLKPGEYVAIKPIRVKF